MMKLKQEWSFHLFTFSMLFTVLSHADIDEECYISIATPEPLPYCYKAEAEFRETSLDKHIKKLGLVRKCKATKYFECHCPHDQEKNRAGCFVLGHALDAYGYWSIDLLNRFVLEPDLDVDDSFMSAYPLNRIRWEEFSTPLTTQKMGKTDFVYRHLAINGIINDLIICFVCCLLFIVYLRISFKPFYWLLEWFTTPLNYQRSPVLFESNYFQHM